MKCPIIDNDDQEDHDRKNAFSKLAILINFKVFVSRVAAKK
jgi:hypothetical protein